MKRLIIIPYGWPCQLSECRPGIFIHNGNIGFKSEYRTNVGKIEAYNEAGEFFCPPDQNNCIVQPCDVVWEDI